MLRCFGRVIGQILQPGPDALLLGGVPALSRAQFVRAECRSALTQSHGAALFESPHARGRFADRGADRQHAIAAQNQSVGASKGGGCGRSQ